MQAERTARPRLLVVIRGDGFLELYGDTDIRVHVAVEVQGSDATALLREQYFETTLPRVFREVFYPINLLWQGPARPPTAEAELYYRQLLSAVRAVKELPLHVAK